MKEECSQSNLLVHTHCFISHQRILWDHVFSFHEGCTVLFVTLFRAISQWLVQDCTMYSNTSIDYQSINKHGTLLCIIMSMSSIQHALLEYTASSSISGDPKCPNVQKDRSCDPSSVQYPQVLYFFIRDFIIAKERWHRSRPRPRYCDQGPLEPTVRRGRGGKTEGSEQECPPYFL